jgi:thioredoxin reductase
MAELTRPFPPGSYPVIVIGSGPGGLQVAYSLRAHGVTPAVLSADPAPGGMFRRWPFFQRLLSWTKPHAPAARGTPAYERYDWNSLLGDEPATCALAPTFMDGTSYFPSRPEMEANLAAFADRAAIDVRYDCRWTGTRPLDGPADADRFELETSDGRYTCQVLVLAVGVAEPYTPPGPGMEHTYHYADVRPPESYAGRRVCILGKQNSGFELANGLLPWARQLVLTSPSHAKLSVETRSLVGVRARYVQPYEDHVLGGGVTILDAAIDRIERGPDGVLDAHLRRTDGGGDLVVTVDDVISATGFVAPLADLPDHGLTTFGASRLPVVTPWWESTTLPGVFVAGTLSQAARGLGRHGLPANSGAVHGSRYNARVLARHLARTHFGVEGDTARIPAEDLPDRLVAELAEGSDIFHQRGYLARLVTVDPGGGFRDDGIQPLAHILDAGGPDGIAATLEADGSGAIYPILFTRRGGSIAEHKIDPGPLAQLDRVDARRVVEDAIARL